MTSTLDSVLLVMMLLAVPLLLPLLIEVEITKNIPICICILIDELFSGQRKSRQVQICTVLTKLTYRIGVRGAFIWWRTVIPRFTWFPAECYKTNGTLKDLIVFQWKIKILIQFFFISYALNNHFQWNRDNTPFQAHKQQSVCKLCEC